jgi:uncharacterized protein YhaN
VSFFKSKPRPAETEDYSRLKSEYDLLSEAYNELANTNKENEQKIKDLEKEIKKLIKAKISYTGEFSNVVCDFCHKEVPFDDISIEISRESRKVKFKCKDCSIKSDLRN